MPQADKELLEALDRLAAMGLLPIVYTVEDDEEDKRSVLDYLIDFGLVPVCVLAATVAVSAVASLCLWAIFSVWATIWTM